MTFWWRTRKLGSFHSPAPATWGCTSTNWLPRHPKASSGSSASSRKWVARTLSSLIAKRTSMRLSWACSIPLSGFKAKSAQRAPAPSWMKRSMTSFSQKLKAKAEALTVGPSDQIENYMGPVINARAKENILGLHRDRQEGRPADCWRRARRRRWLFHQAHRDRRCRLQGAHFPGRDFRAGARGDQGKGFRSCSRACQRFRVRTDRRGVHQ